jgi:CHAP domain
MGIKLLMAAPVVVILLFVGLFAGGGQPGAGAASCQGQTVALCPSLTGNQIASAAQMIASHLQMCGGYDKCYSDMPAVVMTFWQQRCPIIAACYADWQNGNLQCVMLADGAYGIAGDTLPATGNAIDFWGLYVHRDGWIELTPNDGLPAPGDLIVWSHPGTVPNLGHIAVAVALQSDANGAPVNMTIAEANGPAPFVQAPIRGGVMQNPLDGVLLGYIRHVAGQPAQHPVATGERAFVCVLLPAARLASAEIPIGANGQTSPWYVSVILAQWGIEQGWQTPNPLMGYNLGNVRSVPGQPTVGAPGNGSFVYAATLQAGVYDYVYTVQHGPYAAVAAAYHTGPDAQASALGTSPWDAGHYQEGGGAPGQDLITSLQLYHLTQFDQPDSAC